MKMKIVSVLAMLLGLSTALRFDAKLLVGPAKPLKEVLRTGLATVVLFSAAPSNSAIIETLADGIGIDDVVEKKDADSTVARPAAVLTYKQQKQLDADVKAKIKKYASTLTFGEFDERLNKLDQDLSDLNNMIRDLKTMNTNSMYMIGGLYFFEFIDPAKDFINIARDAILNNFDRGHKYGNASKVEEEEEEEKEKKTWFWRCDE